MSTTAAIGIVMLLVFIIPVFIVMQKQKSSKKKLEIQLANIEKENNLKISDHESWNNKVIGIDNSKKVALFVIRNQNNSDVKIVNLHEITKTAPERSIISPEDGSNIQEVSAVRIRFACKDKNKSDSVFTLFDETSDHTINDEIYLANIWSERFNQAIKA